MGNTVAVSTRVLEGGVTVIATLKITNVEIGVVQFVQVGFGFVSGHCPSTCKAYTAKVIKVLIKVPMPISECCNLHCTRLASSGEIECASCQKWINFVGETTGKSISVALQ